MKTIKVKASSSSLHFELEDSAGMKNPRIFSVLPNKLTIIPMDYAKSFYNSSSVINWISNGYLVIVQGKEELEKQAIEEQFITEPIVPVNQERIINTLKGSNLTALKELMRGENKELALELAGEHADQLTQAFVSFIEDETGISLSND